MYYHNGVLGGEICPTELRKFKMKYWAIEFSLKTLLSLSKPFHSPED